MATGVITTGLCSGDEVGGVYPLRGHAPPYGYLPAQAVRPWAGPNFLSPSGCTPRTQSSESDEESEKLGCTVAE